MHRTACCSVILMVSVAACSHPSGTTGYGDTEVGQTIENGAGAPWSRRASSTSRVSPASSAPALAPRSVPRAAVSRSTGPPVFGRDRRRPDRRGHRLHGREADEGPRRHRVCPGNGRRPSGDLGAEPPVGGAAIARWSPGAGPAQRPVHAGHGAPRGRLQRRRRLGRPRQPRNCAGARCRARPRQRWN